jgi:hypothetical protein
MNKYSAWLSLGAATFGIAALLPSLALAQEPAPPPAAPPAAPPAPAAEPAPAPAPEPAPVAPPPAATEEAPAAAAAEAEAAPVPPAAPVEEAPPAEEKYTVTTGVGIRVGARFQNLRDPEEVGMFSFDSVNAELRFSGRVTPIVGWTANLTVDGRTPTTVLNGPPAPPAGPPIVFEARAMDVIAQLDFMDEFHVWAGRMLTPSDRTNFSGPWFIAPWEYPGVYNVPNTVDGSFFAYVGPRGTEEIGREVGTVVWGDIGKGKFKYYLGMLDVDDAPANTPLYTARLGYAIIGSEPGFYGSSTYYGAQDILAVGAAVQYQDRLGTGGDSVTEFNADVLAEFNIGTAGTVGVEGAYYHFDDESPLLPADDAFFVVGSYLLPNAIGIGKPQLVLRYQAAMSDDADDPGDMSMIEVGAAYVIKDYFAKLMLGYEYTKISPQGDADDIKGNAIRLGFQVQQ